MGTFRVPVEIGDAYGADWKPVDALVDTGATYTTVPAALLDRLGVRPHARASFVLADGREIEQDIGQTWVRVGDRAVVTVVVFAPDNAPVLLGAYALEGLRLAADPVGRRLVPVPALFLAAH
jgi:clan AA aspartic protease